MVERSTPGSGDWSESPGWSGPPGGPARPPSSPGAGSSAGSWGAPTGPAGPAPGSWGAPSGPPGPPTTGWGSPPSPPGPPTGGPGGSWSGAPAGPSTAVATPSGGVTGPPTWLLLIGLVVPIAALALTVVGTWPAYAAGWVLAVFGSVIPLALFTRIDLQRRLSAWYLDRRGLLAVLRVAVLVVGLVVACWFGYLIADLVARSDFFAS